MTQKLPRRALLRGLGGVAIALPTLEIMGPSAWSGATRGRAAAADPPPPRFIVSYAGTSTGADTTRDDLLKPPTIGARYEVRPALAPLEALGLRDRVSVVTNLKIPWGTSSSIPAGGRAPTTVHFRSYRPQVCGMKVAANGNTPEYSSCDQIVADAIAGDTPFRTLAYRLQADSGGRISWRVQDGRVNEIDPIASPRLAFESLFSGFAPSDPAGAMAARAALAERRSILDLVRGNTERLVARLGSADRRRIERHLDEIRALENRLDALDDGPSGAACRAPAAPGADPPVRAGWSDENARGEALTDIISLAFACDRSRVASYLLTEIKCYMDMNPISGGRYRGNVHSMTHSGGNQAGLSTAIAWFVRQWGLLLKKLADLPEADGSRVLDHTAAVLFFEAGHGFDPNTGRENRSHSTENMTVLVGGGGAGRLVSGHHIAGRERHPAQAVLAAMHSIGVTPPALGEVRGPIDELLTR